MNARVGVLVAFLFAALLVVPSISVADESGAFQGKPLPVVVSPSPQPDTYGLADHTALMLGSFMFQGYQPTTVLSATNGIERWISSGSFSVEAHPVMPNGALIESIELRACDLSDAAAVTAFLGTCNSPGLGCTLAVSVTTGIAATPGCGNFSIPLPVPLQVNNQNPIVVEVATGDTSTTTFSGVKIYYRLQVSPAPSVATFTDVPVGYWAFQYIEALEASGITQGVTPTTYEPESPVTRAQMAVFLAKALGLHWPN